MNTTSIANEVKQATTLEGSLAVKPRYVLETLNQDQTIRIELPGVLRESVAVNLEANTLKVSARRMALIPKDARVLHRELHTRDYELRVRLNHEIDQERLSAVFVNGVLSIHLPHRESAKSRNVTVQ